MFHWLQVSSEGDVLYALPRGFRGAITARSWKLRAAPYFKKVPSPIPLVKFTH